MVNITKSGPTTNHPTINLKKFIALSHLVIVTEEVCMVLTLFTNLPPLQICFPRSQWSGINY